MKERVIMITNINSILICVHNFDKALVFTEGNVINGLIFQKSIMMDIWGLKVTIGI